MTCSVVQSSSTIFTASSLTGMPVVTIMETTTTTSISSVRQISRLFFDSHFIGHTSFCQPSIVSLMVIV